MASSEQTSHLRGNQLGNAEIELTSWQLLSRLHAPAPALGSEPEGLMASQRRSSNWCHQTGSGDWFSLAGVILGKALFLGPRTPPPPLES